MEKKKYSFFEQKEEVSVSDSDFTFVQADKKIHDKKFETKPTTFFKDALKRFSKNKSSVVASCFLGALILLAIAVPLFNTSPVDASIDSNKFRFLPPKWQIFENSNGFLDGTTYKTNVPMVKNSNGDYIPYSKEDYREHCIVSEIKTRIDVLNGAAKEYAYGGQVRLSPDKPSLDAAIGSLSLVNVDLSKDYDIEIYLPKEPVLNTLNVDNINVLPTYALKVGIDSSSSNEEVTLLQSNTFCENNQPIKVFNLKDKLGEYLTAKGRSDSSLNVSFRFYCLNNIEDTGKYPSIFVESFVGYERGKKDVDTSFEKVNFLSGNELMLRNLSTDDEVNATSWKIPDVSGVSAASLSVSNASMVYGEFRYDDYEHALGKAEHVEVDYGRIQTYIEKGWMSYDIDVGETSFQLINPEKCPIISVDEQIDESGMGTVAHHIYCTVIQYKLYGFESMPYFIFGTDAKGLDFFKMVFRGLGFSLLLGFCIAAVNITIGLIYGSIAGYYGGYVDLFMERFTEIIGGIPGLVLLTLFSLVLGQNFGVFLLASCITGWIGVAGGTRSQFYRYKGREYVLAARTLGASNTRLIFRHILPNSIGPIITSSVLMIPGAIFSESTLSFLGLGFSEWSFGNLLSKGQTYISSYPNLLLAPAIIMSILMISFNLFGNGLRDAFNPSLKGSD